MSAFHIAGDIIDTTMTAIEVALIEVLPQGAKPRREAGEIAVRLRQVNIDIYEFRPSGPGRSDFLLGGKMHLDREASLHLLQSFASALQQRDIVFRFNMYDEMVEPRRLEKIISHHRFPGRGPE